MIDPSVLIDDARNYAVSASFAATSALNSAMSTVNQIGTGSVPAGGTKPPELTLTLPTPGDPGTPPMWVGVPPDIKTYAGKAPTLETISGFSLPSDPGAAPPVAAFVEPPSPTGGADTSLLNGVPVINSAIAVPPAPIIDVAGIPKPVIIDVVIPPMPTYTPPEFTGVKPSDPGAPPSNLDTLMQTNYGVAYTNMSANTSAAIDTFLDREFPQFRTGIAALETRLATYLQGGTALTPAVENAIYNRTLDKTNSDATRAKSEAWGKAARAGFTMPTPMLLAQSRDIDLERRNNNARAATDIAVKQAELEQQNLQFAVTQSSSLRQVMLTSAMAYFNGLVQINGQALEYARAVVDAVVKAYDIATRYSEVQVRIYESEANVFRAKLEASLAVIQAYEAQIRGVEAQVNVDNAKVTLYRSQLEGAMTQANVYKSQVEAVQAQIEVEKLKIDLYGSKVQAYVAQVNGFTAQWNGYSAAVQGRLGAVQASGEQIKAYAARVNAYQALVQAKSTEIESKARINAQKLDAYRIDVEAYRSLVNATVEQVSIGIKSYDATIQGFIAKANAISAKSQSEVAVYEVGLRGLIEAARLQFEYVREHDMRMIARAEGTARIAEAIGHVYSGLAQSTMAGMNTLAATTQSSSV